jgi:hypothetical protein
MKMAVFWDTAPCSLVEVDRRSRNAYCLHHKGDEGLIMETVFLKLKLLRDYTAQYPRKLPSSASF